MAAKIYTKTGDTGTTSLLGGTRVSKDDLRIETYGTIDELNSYLGLVCDYETDAAVKSLLKEIQDRLFTIGSSLACDPDKETKLRIPDLQEADIALLEKSIDEMNATLPVMKFFILPGGHPAISTCHIARCVCRRAERLCVSLQTRDQFIGPLILKYVNRLSDYLFVLARYTGHRLGVEDIPWRPRV